MKNLLLTLSVKHQQMIAYNLVPQSLLKSELYVDKVDVVRISFRCKTETQYAGEVPTFARNSVCFLSGGSSPHRALKLFNTQLTVDYSLLNKTFHLHLLLLINCYSLFTYT